MKTVDVAVLLAETELAKAKSLRSRLDTGSVNWTARQVLWPIYFSHLAAVSHLLKRIEPDKGVSDETAAG